ncbi:MAG: histidine phosphatase family protein [Dehalococcoidia bacterium]
MRLYLVRHAAVAVREDRPSSQWYLSEEGRAAAEALAAEPYWAEVHALHCSSEPKATGTAQRIAARHGLPVYIEPDLREVERPWAGEGYRDLVRRYLAGEAVAGWEARAAALERVRRCVARINEGAGGRDTAIVSHGLLLTLYLSDLLDLDSAAAYGQWEQIGFPDVALVEPESRRLVRAWSGVR